jgi:hypothetical protein
MEKTIKANDILNDLLIRNALLSKPQQPAPNEAQVNNIYDVPNIKNNTEALNKQRIVQDSADELSKAIAKHNNWAETQADADMGMQKKYAQDLENAYVSDLKAKQDAIDLRNLKIKEKNEEVKINNILSDIANTADAILSTNPDRQASMAGRIAGLVPRQQEQQELDKAEEDRLGLTRMKKLNYVKPDKITPIEEYRLRAYDAKMRKDNETQNESELYAKGAKFVKEQMNMKARNDFKEASETLAAIGRYQDMLDRNDLAVLKEFTYERAKQMDPSGRISDQDFINAGVELKIGDQLDVIMSKVTGMTPANTKRYIQAALNSARARVANNMVSAQGTLKNHLKYLNNNKDVDDSFAFSMMQPYLTGIDEDTFKGIQKANAAKEAAKQAAQQAQQTGSTDGFRTTSKGVKYRVVQ